MTLIEIVGCGLMKKKSNSDQCESSGGHGDEYGQHWSPILAAHHTLNDSAKVTG